VWPLAALVLIAGHVILYAVLPFAGVSAAVASGVVVVIVMKHLGMLGVVLTPLYDSIRRRFRR
jgi:hypothetical protein